MCTAVYTTFRGVGRKRKWGLNDLLFIGKFKITQRLQITACHRTQMCTICLKSSFSLFVIYVQPYLLSNLIRYNVLKIYCIKICAPHLRINHSGTHRNKSLKKRKLYINKLTSSWRSLPHVCTAKIACVLWVFIYNTVEIKFMVILLKQPCSSSTSRNTRNHYTSMDLPVHVTD